MSQDDLSWNTEAALSTLSFYTIVIVNIVIAVILLLFIANVIIVTVLSGLFTLRTKRCLSD